MLNNNIFLMIVNNNCIFMNQLVTLGPHINSQCITMYSKGLVWAVNYHI